ncbi:MAG: hypothetical protein HDR06_04195 [Lachnospiraceae bacterium]|nr:hypothetical protein [Lachnospiraceae bacterium]
MNQYEVLAVKELFAGSDIVRRFTYKTELQGITMPFFGTTDCFVCCSPRDELTGSMAVL